VYAKSGRPATVYSPVAWAGPEDEWAVWTYKRLVNRTDARGGYRSVRQQRRGLGRTTTRKSPLTRDHLRRHFAARGPGDVIGVHAIAPDNTCRWLAVEVDRHDDKDDPAANLRAVIAWYNRLRSRGFHPLLEDSNGNGGYHVWLLFREPVPAADAYRFAKSLVSDHAAHGLAAEPETFPRQPALTGKGFGNFLRLPGRHHSRDHWSRVWNGSEWLAGERAVRFMLSLDGDDPGLIPQAKNGAAEQTYTRSYKNTKSSTWSPPRAAPALPAPILAVVRASVPAGTGQRHRSIWRLVGRLKALPDVAWERALKEAAFAEWWRLAEPVVRTKDRLLSAGDYAAAWAARKFPEGAMAGLMEAALSHPLPELDLPEAARKLGAVCRELGRGGATFFLSQTTPAGLLGVSPRHVHRLCRMLIGLDVLEVVEPGDSFPGGDATSYRWLGEPPPYPPPAVVRPTKRPASKWRNPRPKELQRA
jgi:hypothetical protein